MKTILGLVLILAFGASIGVYSLWNDSPFEVAKRFFEHSRNHEIESATRLWNLDPPQDPTLPQVKNNEPDSFRRDIFYAEEIAEGGDQIIDHREFRKNGSKTILCLSLRNEKGLKRVFRVEMVKTNFVWKISDMMNANEDALAAMHKDCSTVEF